MSIAKNDTIVRAVKTFVQAFLGQAAVLLPAVQEDLSTKAAFALVTSAAAAGISAVWNGVVNPWVEARKASQ